MDDADTKAALHACVARRGLGLDQRRVYVAARLGAHFTGLYPFGGRIGHLLRRPFDADSVQNSPIPMAEESIHRSGLKFRFSSEPRILLTRSFQIRIGDATPQSGAATPRFALPGDLLAVDRDVEAALLLFRWVHPGDANITSFIEVPASAVAGAGRILVGYDTARQEVDVEGVASVGRAGQLIALYRRQGLIAL